MRRMIVFLCVASAFLAVTARAYTMPTKAPYDALISEDRGALPHPSNSLLFDGAFVYSTASKEYGKGGTAIDPGFEWKLIAVPFGVGYAFNEWLDAGVKLQLLRPDDGSATAFGLGDVWVTTRAVWPLATDFYMGPRFGLKIPVGTVKVEDKTPELGDNQMDLDFAVVAAKYGPSNIFQFNAQAGLRYRMKGTAVWTDEGGAELEYELKPGMMFYGDFAPGLGFGSRRAFKIYVPVGFASSSEDEVFVPDDWPGQYAEPVGYEHNVVYVGLRPSYAFDDNNVLNFKALYNVKGAKVPQAMYFGLSFNASFPL